MKLIIASLIIFSIIILFLFALFPSDISVSRVIQIRTSQQNVQKKIDDLREWGTWNGLLPDSGGHKINLSDKTDSNYILRGNVIIELLKVNRDTVITQWKNEKKTFTGTYIISEVNGQAVVEWTLHFHMHWYPWEKLASMFYDKQLGPVMENSLLKLRNELEKK